MIEKNQLLTTRERTHEKVARRRSDREKSTKYNPMTRRESRPRTNTRGRENLIGTVPSQPNGSTSNEETNNGHPEGVTIPLTS